MQTDNFQKFYRSTYARLGFPLRAKDGLALKSIRAAERNIGVKLPKALTDYYLVAGRERTLNNAFNFLRHPSEWEVHSKRLIFMEENQCAVVWGIKGGSVPGNDPAVYQSQIVDGEPRAWHTEQIKCSNFLVFALHLQSAYGGGMPLAASATAKQSLAVTLNKHWHFGGEVGGMRAYSRENQAVCFSKWRGFFDEDATWRVFAGAQTKDGLDSIARDLGLQWES